MTGLEHNSERSALISLQLLPGAPQRAILEIECHLLGAICSKHGTPRRSVPWIILVILLTLLIS